MKAFKVIVDSSSLIGLAQDKKNNSPGPFSIRIGAGFGETGRKRPGIAAAARQTIDKSICIAARPCDTGGQGSDIGIADG
jgi:hypothetical protein